MAARDAAMEEKNEYFDGYFPQVEVRSAAGRIYGDNSTSRGLSVTRGAGYSGFWEGSVTMTQLLFDAGSTQNRVEAAAARETAADYKIIDTREQMALRTVLSYLDVMRGREALAAALAHKGKIDDYIARIGRMVDEGAADASMTVQARDVRTQLEDTLISLEGQLRKSAAEYAEITGHEPDEDMNRPSPEDGILPSSTEDALKMALETHPSLIAASLSGESYDHEARSERAKLTPALNGELSYLKRDQRDIIGGEVTDARALVRMNWKFNVAGAERARLRKAEYRKAESLAKREEMERTVAKAVQVAYSDLETAQRQLDVLRERVDLNRDLLATYEQQFEASRVNLLQLLQAENTLFNAKLERMNGEYRYIGAQYAALAGMGNLQDALNVVPVQTDGQ